MYQAKTNSTKDDEGNPIRKPTIYTTSIRLVKPQFKFVKIDCTCKYHPYWGAEVGLWMRTAADVIRSNGKAPRVRNPRLTPYACKHAVALIKKLQGSGKI